MEENDRLKVELSDALKEVYQLDHMLEDTGNAYLAARETADKLEEAYGQLVYDTLTEIARLQRPWWRRFFR